MAPPAQPAHTTETPAWECFRHQDVEQTAAQASSIQHGGLRLVDVGQGPLPIPPGAPFSAHEVVIHAYCDRTEDHVGIFRLQFFYFGRPCSPKPFMLGCQRLSKDDRGLANALIAFIRRFPPGAILVIRGIEVAPSRRRQGIGKALVEGTGMLLRRHPRYNHFMEKPSRLILDLASTGMLDAGAIRPLLSSLDPYFVQEPSLYVARVREHLPVPPQ